jgi:hypothetical protein
MIKTIKNFIPPKDASPFNPAKKVTVEANSTTYLTLKGRNADVFGIRRMLPFCSDMNAITVKATLNHERILFSGISLAAIHQLFKDGELLAPYIIQKNNDLLFELTNTSGTDLDVNMELLGYDGPSLRKLVQLYNQSSFDMPTPVFLFGSDSIPSKASNHYIEIPTKSMTVDLQRAAITSTKDESISISLLIANEVIKNEVFIEQFNDEFRNGQRLMVPITIGAGKNFNLTASNSDQANDQQISFLGESYITH